MFSFPNVQQPIVYTKHDRVCHSLKILFSKPGTWVSVPEPRISHVSTWISCRGVCTPPVKGRRDKPQIGTQSGSSGGEDKSQYNCSKVSSKN
jgi:hypothetical protein